MNAQNTQFHSCLGTVRTPKAPTPSTTVLVLDHLPGELRTFLTFAYGIQTRHMVKPRCINLATDGRCRRCVMSFGAPSTLNFQNHDHECTTTTKFAWLLDSGMYKKELLTCCPLGFGSLWSKAGLYPFLPTYP